MEHVLRVHALIPHFNVSQVKFVTLTNNLFHKLYVPYVLPQNIYTYVQVFAMESDQKSRWNVQKPAGETVIEILRRTQVQFLNACKYELQTSQNCTTLIPFTKMAHAFQGQEERRHSHHFLRPINFAASKNKNNN